MSDHRLACALATSLSAEFMDCALLGQAYFLHAKHSNGVGFTLALALDCIRLRLNMSPKSRDKILVSLGFHSRDFDPNAHLCHRDEVCFSSGLCTHAHHGAQCVSGGGGASACGEKSAQALGQQAKDLPECGVWKQHWQILTP